jgi:hypothetical protein
MLWPFSPLHKRVIEKVATLLFIASINEATGSSTRVRLEHSEKIADIIYTISFGMPEKPG